MLGNWTVRRWALYGASATGLTMACATGAQAQVATTAPSAQVQSAPAEDVTTIADVIVTATRRAERLSKVPVAVSVVSGETLQASNLNTMRDVTSIVPSLNLRNAASAKDQAFFVRGLGTVSTSSAVEPSVSTVLDGVVLGRQGQAMLDLVDIERIEVLRGPQGTLFGKNASAGVINIVSQNPSNTPTGYVDAFYGTGGDEYRLRASLSGPLAGDTLTGSLNLLYADYDGNVQNLFDGKTVNGYERAGGRVKLRYQPNADADFVLSVDHVYSRETTPTGVVTRTYRIAYPTNARSDFPAFANTLRPLVVSEHNRTVNSDFESYAIDRNSGGSLEGNISLGDHTLTSITAYREYSNKQLQDQDRTSIVAAGVPQSHDIGHLDSHQFTQELRIASPSEGFLTYVAGLYYFNWVDNEDYRRDTLAVSGAGRVANFGTADWRISNRNYSAFGEMTLHFTPRFRALVGGRVVHDELDYRFARVSSSPTVAVPSIQVNFASTGKTERTGYADRLGVQYDLDGVGMAYGTYSRGYKGPAFNVPFSMLAQDTGALKPEINETFEAGLKSRLAGGRVVLNLAAFDSQIKNYQVNFVDVYNGSQVTRLINAGGVSSRGVEADFSARPMAGLTIAGGAAYTKARVDHFSCPVGAAVSCDIDGKPLPFTPKWKTNVRVSYAMPLSDALKLELSTDYDWRSDVQFSINQTPDTVQNSYGIWNAGVTLTGFADMQLSIIVKNIANQRYATTLTTFGTGVARYVPRDDQRYFGFGLRKSF